MMKNNIKPNIQIQKRGFTIVETLVAIAVLMIAISGPLVIASKGLTAALYSKDQMIASFLAQESMEVIKNIRDQGLNSGNWLGEFMPASCANPNANNDCDADPHDPDMVRNCGGGSDGCPIYYDEDTGYTSEDSGNQSTIFSRYFNLENVIDNATGNPDPNQKMAHVIVKWKVGTIPFETEITSLLTNELR